MQCRNAFQSVLANQHQQMKHLVPRSHKFQTHFSLLKQQRSWPSERTTHNRQRISPRTVMADSQVVNCNRFSYQQVIHILPSLRAPHGYTILIGKDRFDPDRNARLKSIPSQYTLLDRSINNSVQDKPVIPFNIGGLLNMVNRVAILSTS